MTLKLRPPRQPKLTQRQVRSIAYQSAARICGQMNQHINIGKKKST